MTTANAPHTTQPWTGEHGYVRLMIKDLRTEVRLGVHPWERHDEKPQRVIVNIEMFADDLPPRHEEGVSSIVDYDYIREALKKWPTRPQVLLIEMLLEELAALCFQDARVKACKVAVVKPDIYNEASGAGVELYRVRK